MKIRELKTKEGYSHFTKTNIFLSWLLTNQDALHEIHSALNKDS